MQTSPGADVLISEVGPRDGLQSVKSVMATPAKPGPGSSPVQARTRRDR